MMREWEPCDLAVVDCLGTPTLAMWAGDECEPVRADNGNHPREPHWHTASGRFLTAGARDARPLVVIDPEDREQVVRVARCAYAYDGPYGADRLQAALREFVNPAPPKPPEPTGLGAVVEDEGGVDWHRTREGRWIAGDGLRSRGAGWPTIAAVRVLSDGVEVDR